MRCHILQVFFSAEVSACHEKRWMPYLITATLEEDLDCDDTTGDMGSSDTEVN